MYWMLLPLEATNERNFVRPTQSPRESWLGAIRSGLAALLAWTRG